LCRRLAADLTALRPEFEKAGAKLAVVSSLDTGAQDFLDAVWPNGELYIDEAEAFKYALGGEKYKYWWLLRPSVIAKIVSFVRSYGTFTGDTTDKKTQMLGGTFVVKGGEVVFMHRETATFDNGDAREILAAVLGKDVADVPQTPVQEAVTCSLPTKS